MRGKSSEVQRAASRLRVLLQLRPYCCNCGRIAAIAAVLLQLPPYCGNCGRHTAVRLPPGAGFSLSDSTRAASSRRAAAATHQRISTRRCAPRGAAGRPSRASVRVWLGSGIERRGAAPPAVRVRPLTRTAGRGAEEKFLPLFSACLSLYHGKYWRRSRPRCVAADAASTVHIIIYFYNALYIFIMHAPAASRRREFSPRRQ